MSTETLNLDKGQKLDLTKTNPTLAILAVGMGWDVNAGNGAAFDLDASAILLNASDKLVGPTLNESVVYFRNLNLPGVTHSGDNRTGAGDGDDETVKVTFADVRSDVNSIVFVANIYQAADRGQNFGQVRNTHIRVYDANTNEELGKYDPSEDYSQFDALVLGKVYRHNGEWKFQAIGEGKKGNLAQLVDQYK